MSSYTPNIDLLLTPESDTTTTFKEWRTGINGEGDNSNMSKIDKEVGQLKDTVNRNLKIPTYFGKIIFPKFFAQYKTYGCLRLFEKEGNQETFVDITKTSPDKFNVILVNNNLVQPTVEYHDEESEDYDIISYPAKSIRMYSGGVGFDPQDADNYQNETPLHKYSPAGSVTILLARDMANTDSYIYHFEKRDNGSYILLNAQPLGFNTIATSASIGYGLARVIDRCNRDWPITGEALSAYQGYLLNNKIDMKGDGKRTCRFVVGTSTAGWTAADVDYLCDGTADDVEINAAIQALPSIGGEIMLLDGRYNITIPILLNKGCITLTGNGKSTVLNRMFDSEFASGGSMILISSHNNILQDFIIEGNKEDYTGTGNFGIYCGSCNNTIRHIVCSNNYLGIYISKNSNDNMITNNIWEYNDSIGIEIHGNNNTITGNVCNGNIHEGIGSGISAYDGSWNIITENICNNNQEGIQSGIQSVGNTIEGNICKANSDCGIGIRSCNTTIIGNTCCDNHIGVSVMGSKNNVLGNNIIHNNSRYGIYIYIGSGHTITGNTCTDNSEGVYLGGGSTKNTIVGNTIMRGSGLSTDYASTQYTIYIFGSEDNNNLIAYNNLFGKNYISHGGTGNTFTGNKYN